MFIDGEGNKFKLFRIRILYAVVDPVGNTIGEPCFKAVLGGRQVAGGKEGGGMKYPIMEIIMR